MTAPDDLEARLRRAVARRASIRADATTTAYRAANGDGDDVPGLTVDDFAGVAVLSLYDDLGGRAEDRVVRAVAAALEPRAVYLKRRPREARRVATTNRAELAPLEPAWGEAAPEVIALERGRRYLIRPGGDLSVGLFLDMRDARSWLADRARGRTVLNAFAYTCGFGVAAALGGAARIVNVDLSRRVLDWGEANYRLNGLEPARHDFVSGDVFDWLARFARRGEAFDTVVLDPPSFATSRSSRFSAAAHYDRLAALAARVVAPGGVLLAATNHARLPRRQFLAMLESGVRAAGRDARVLASMAAPPDFPVRSNAESPLKVFALELD